MRDDFQRKPNSNRDLYKVYKKEQFKPPPAGDEMIPLSNNPTFALQHGDQRRVLYLGNQHCAGTAEAEGAGSPYAFPVSSSNLTGLWQPPTGSGGPMIDPQTLEYNLNYGPFLSLSLLVKL